jgi:putative endonuclease
VILNLTHLRFVISTEVFALLRRRSGETRSFSPEATMREYEFHVYIMASRSLTLYIGFTSRLYTRVRQHKAGTFAGFSKTYQCHRLVYYERYQTATIGIAREKQLKRWSREKKIALIKTMNATWADLSEDWDKPIEPLHVPNPVK